MKKLLLTMLIATTAYAQEPTGPDDRGPWGGTSLTIDATRCAEFRHVWNDLGGNDLLLIEVFRTNAGRAFIPVGSTATNTMTQQLFNRSFNLEPSGTTLSTSLLARMYRRLAQSRLNLFRGSGNTQYALRNAHANITVRNWTQTKKDRFHARIEQILSVPESLE